MINGVVKNAEETVKDNTDNMTLLVGGFGFWGISENCISALVTLVRRLYITSPMSILGKFSQKVHADPSLKISKNGFVKHANMGNVQIDYSAFDAQSERDIPMEKIDGLE